jgi:hypothetical protein
VRAPLPWLTAAAIALGAGVTVAVADEPAPDEPAEEPAGAPPADPVAVAGRYDLKLAWKGCAPAGAKTATVELSPIDSRLELDLGPARAGLPVIVVAGDAVTLTGTSADVTATLTWGKRGVAIAIELASGCRARGTAKRQSSTIAACDRLAALARLERGCGAIAPDARTEDVAAIDAQRPAWARLSGKTKRADAEAACAHRVAVLEPPLVDAACLAVPADEAPTLIEECRDLAARIDRYSRCRTLPADARTRLREMLGTISVSVIGADPDEQYLARQACLRQRETLDQLAPYLHCD